MPLPSDIDISIRPLIEYLNEHPDFETTLSCSGHYKLCIHQCSKTKDDWDLFRECNHQYCTGTTQPSLQFKVKNEVDSKWQNFFDYLRDTSQQNYPSTLWHSKTSPEYSYGYSDGDEGFTLDRKYIHEVVGMRPLFYEFWQKFLNGWKIYIDDSCDVDRYQPRSFELKWLACYNNDNDNLESYEPEIDPAGDLCE